MSLALISTAMFYNFYYSIKSNPIIPKLPTRGTVATRLTSTAHAIILIGMSIIYLLNGMSDSLWAQLQAISVGYCIYHSLIMFNEPEAWYFYIILKNITMIINAGFISPLYPVEGAMIYLSEFPTPVFNQIYFLTRQTEKDINTIKHFSTLLIALYFIVRIVIFAHCVWAVWEKTNFLIFTWMVMMWMINLKMFTKLCQEHSFLIKEAKENTNVGISSS